MMKEILERPAMKENRVAVARASSSFDSYWSAIDSSRPSEATVRI